MPVEKSPISKKEKIVKYDLDKRIHLALSPWDLTDSYNQHAGVTIASFLENCHGEKAIIHLLYDEKLNQKNPEGAEDNKKKYSELCNKFGADIYYHHIQLPEWVSENKMVKQLSPGTLMRFYLSEILPNVDKILYLDCDIVVNTDIRKLWATDITSASLAAARDLKHPIRLNHLDYFQRINTSREQYFNAGVMLLNLKYFRDHAISSNNLLQDLHENLWYPYADQDVFNKFFGNNYKILDRKYNIMVGGGHEIEYEIEGIIHYASPIKPWGAYHGLHDLPYWHYLLQTPWGNDVEKILNITLSLHNFAYTDPNFSKGFSYAPIYIPFMKRMIVVLFMFSKKRIGDFIKEIF